MECILEESRVRVFYDGTLTDPQLDHAECVAVHPDGSAWCGGERGQIYRLDAAGTVKQVADTGGFCLGMAFDAAGNLFVCDLKHAAVMRMDAAAGRVERFADGIAGHRIRVPKYPAFAPDGRLYVSDSHHQDEPGPGIFRFQPDGSGELWYDQPLRFANGLAFSPDGDLLYVVDTLRHAVVKVRVLEDGTPGPAADYAVIPGVLPDGVAVGRDGAVYVGCYEPSQVLQISLDGRVQCLFADPTARTLCHPTNLAFAGTTLLTANLGRWHLTVLDIGAEGVPLPMRKPR